MEWVQWSTVKTVAVLLNKNNGHAMANLINALQGGSPGLVVMGRDSRSEGRGFESQHHILDGNFSHIVKIVMFV